MVRIVWECGMWFFAGFVSLWGAWGFRACGAGVSCAWWARSECGAWVSWELLRACGVCA
ncbi:hypothetical protein OFO12_00390 [Campylobacter sp. JMF_04 NA10]|uniref:hypothetical protein n=1 Tax=Campylobacter sp. JMF_04 NA10 TaxID=2983824 RepID=UPI0022EA09DB|nr:hypothetical protein [Campylobacter sp. JMF_04 NA10]MDA3075829.1 hypothetical protein [Campylobacter sp. JMF_04 NA10]